VAQTVPGANGYSIKGSQGGGTFHSRYVPAIARARDELGVDVWTPLREAILRTARWASSRETIASPECRP
jgi:dTDP-glucose 4,6-dehydratase